KNSEHNIDKLLQQLADKKDKGARFRTVICLIIDGTEHLFEGIAEGQITTARKGVDGFGYDPVFIPSGSEFSLAEMTLQQKNEISHRGIAIKKLTAYLKSII